MSTDRDVKINYIYRHWGGGKYKVLGELKIINNFREEMTIKTPYGFAITATKFKPEDDGVIYESLDGEKFIREKSNFLEILGDKEEGTMYYRFEAIAPC